MKKKFLIITLIFTLLVSLNVYASSDINIIIDNEKFAFEPGPIIKNESTLVPMRALFETLGAKVTWYDSTRTVSAVRNNTNVKLTIDSDKAIINGKVVLLSVKPEIINEKTYVPLRFISESLGAQVAWDGLTRTITIRDKTKISENPIELVDSQKYELRTTYNFVNEGDEADIDVSILAGGLSTSKYQKDDSIIIYPNPYEITEDNYGNKIVKIKGDNLRGGESFNISIAKKLENSGIKYSIDKNNIYKDFSILENYNTYVRPQVLIESDNEDIIKKANELAGEETNPYEIAKKIYEYVNLNITYDMNPEYAGKGALHALYTKRGVCEEFSKLFAALLRAKHIPSRTVYGYWLQDNVKDEIGYDWYKVEGLRHEWPEFYLPGYGWIICEPTYKYKINGIDTVPWDQFANQNENGHIIDGYKPDTQDQIKWSVEGYGRLNVRLENTTTEIRKID
jgi:transglutaminase-like putative cysteine protease